MSRFLNIDLTGEKAENKIDNEHYLNAGPEKFYLNHDRFFGNSFSIYTGVNKTGTELQIGVDYNVGDSDDILTSRVGSDIFSSVIIINTDYQSVELYINYQCCADIIDAEDPVLEGFPIGGIINWPWGYGNIPTGFLAMLGGELSRRSALWSIAQNNLGNDRFHFGPGNGTSTFTLPDWTGIVHRGAVYIEVESTDWDDANDRIELGYEDLPNGTPVKANQTAGGLKEGTVYYLALDPAGSGPEYFIYDTESNANANDGSTGLIDLSAITANVVLSGSGEFQNHALQGHDFYIFTDDSTGRYTGLDHDGTPAALGNTIAGDYAYNIAGGTVTTAANKGKTNGGITDDGKSGPLRTANESRMANVQGIWIIKAEHVVLTADESLSLSQRVENLENAKVPDPYISPWTLCTEWTAGNSITITHGLNKPFNELTGQIFVRDPAVPDGIYNATDLEVATTSLGQRLNGDGTLNSCKIQLCAVNGAYRTATGALNVVPTTWEYQVRIEASQGKTFIQAVTETEQILHVVDRKTAGTTGGTTSAGLNIRTLNHVVKNTIVGSSLSFNQIILPAGTYSIEKIKSPVYRVRRNVLKLYNITDSSVQEDDEGNAIERNTYCNATDGFVMTEIEGFIFTLTESKALSLYHYVQDAVAEGLGVDSGTTFGNVYNYYAEAIIKKIG